MADELRDNALKYDRFPLHGQLAIHAIRPMASQRALTLVYSPGVAAACGESERDPDPFIEIVAGLEATFGGSNPETVTVTVAKAAMDSGVAARPIDN